MSDEDKDMEIKDEPDLIRDGLRLRNRISALEEELDSLEEHGGYYISHQQIEHMREQLMRLRNQLNRVGRSALPMPAHIFRPNPDAPIPQHVADPLLPRLSAVQEQIFDDDPDLLPLDPPVLVRQQAGNGNNDDLDGMGLGLFRQRADEIGHFDRVMARRQQDNPEDPDEELRRIRQQRIGRPRRGRDF